MTEEIYGKYVTYHIPEEGICEMIVNGVVVDTMTYSYGNATCDIENQDAVKTDMAERYFGYDEIHAWYDYGIHNEGCTCPGCSSVKKWNDEHRSNCMPERSRELRFS